MHLGRVVLSPGCLWALALGWYLGAPSLLSAFLLAAAAHELGHIALCGALGIPIRQLRLSLLGAELRLEGADRQGWRGELLVAAAGPAVNLLLATAAAGIGRGQEFLCLFAGASVVLGVFNLLPVLPLDGGRVLAALCCAWAPADRAAAAAEWISMGTVALLLALGVTLFVRGNGSLLLLAVFLLVQHLAWP